MLELNTFKEVADALREAEEMRVAGKYKRIGYTWVDEDTSPIGVCAAGGIALVAGMEPGKVWSANLERKWPIMLRNVTNPVTSAETDLLTVISQLNESPSVSWVDIADWLERL